MQMWCGRMKARHGNNALNFLNWSGSMKVGDLVRLNGILGIVTAPCIKRWAKSGDVWVLWNNRHKPIVECSGFLELVNESR